jgi:hypothetical protein
MKHFFRALILTAFIAGVIGLAMSGDSAEKPKKADNNKETCALGDLSDKYEAAEFEHWKHQDIYKFENSSISCAKCHHESKKTDGSDAQKCSFCHKKEETEKDGKKALPLEKAYHETCKGCHKKTTDAGNKNAPTKCTECHAKKKTK